MTIKQWCFNSATIAWAYFVGSIGIVLDTVVSAQDIFPNLQTTLVGMVSPKTAAWIVISFAVITFLARMRSLRKNVANT